MDHKGKQQLSNVKSRRSEKGWGGVVGSPTRCGSKVLEIGIEEDRIEKTETLLGITDLDVLPMLDRAVPQKSPCVCAPAHAR